MWKLIKFFVGLLVFGMLAYGFVTVSFGEKTLLGHFMGISKTEEAQSLKQEVSRKLEKTAVEIKNEVTKTASDGDSVAASSDQGDGGYAEARPKPNNEHLSNTEKDALRKLLGEKLSQN